MEVVSLSMTGCRYVNYHHASGTIFVSSTVGLILIHEGARQYNLSVLHNLVSSTTNFTKTGLQEQQVTCT